MKSFIKNSLAIIGALVLAGLFAACSFHGGPDERAQWMQKKVTKELKLDAPQQLQLESLGDEIQQARKVMKEQFAGKHDQLPALLEQPVMDREALTALVNSHTQLINELSPGIIAAASDFYDGLNVEQQAQIREFILEHRESGSRWGRRHHN